MENPERENVAGGRNRDGSEAWSCVAPPVAHFMRPGAYRDIPDDLNYISLYPRKSSIGLDLSDL